MPDIRLAHVDDISEILAISNHYALHTHANFAVEPEPLEQWQKEYDATHELYPWLVSVEKNTISGFAKASPWNGRCAYAYSAETTVYLKPESLSKGNGRALYDVLFAMLRAQKYCTLIAGISLPNEPSERLHESMGMKRVALFQRVGWKYNRWHDVGYWELHLCHDDRPPKPIRLVAEVAEQFGF